MRIIKRVKGTQDVYPPRSLLYQKIQQVINEILDRNGYQSIIFPTFEYRELFTNSLGSTTDIIHKEMYSFLDRKGRELVLRPEGTASVVRLICQNKLVKEGYPLKFYYWANMFRYERPQKGRYREFWQLGVELVNASGIFVDYQILKLVADILYSLGITSFTFNLNYLGDSETKDRYKRELKIFIEKNALELCEICQKRYQSNPLRILDCLVCKNKSFYPSYKEVWHESDNNYINGLNQILDKFNLPYQYDYFLVRGLDYYTGLVFEVNLEGEKALLGGGRYDKLYHELGNVNLPAVGFAVGIERLTNYLSNYQPNSKLLKINRQVDVFFLATIPEVYWDILVWKGELENCLLLVEYNLEVRKIKSLPKIINYYQPKLLIVLGKEELKNEKIFIKDCQKKQLFPVEKKELITWIFKYLTDKKSK